MRKHFLLFLSVNFLFACSQWKELRQVKVMQSKQRSQYEAYGKEYMIATQGDATTKAAKFVFDQGGNIYDAAVAASFAISVERPHSTGIGGGGFMLLHNGKTGESSAVDFREMAPNMASKSMFLDKKQKQIKDKSLTGPFAVGVPGVVAGVLSVHKKYGKLPLRIVMKPAIDLARNGMPVYPALAEAMQSEAKRLCQFAGAKKIFLKDNCKAYNPGEVLYQKDLANTLERISVGGEDEFYRGKTASLIVQNQKEYHGLIKSKDLKNYKVKFRDPVKGEYRGYKIISMPPPSSGGTHIIQILNILENFSLKELGPQNPKSIHLTASAMQLAFADRASHMGDSDFNPIPVDELVSKNYAKKLSSYISEDRAIPSQNLQNKLQKTLKESDHTTHFTIMDKDGNVITSTQTINGWFGSAMVADGTGIVMNNEMDDFASHVGGTNLFGAIGGKNNLVEPRKRPLSSMSPTIVFDHSNRPMLALGTPSGTRILTCVMQTVLNVLEYEMPLWEAVSATRYHHQWYPEEIRIGPPGFSNDIENELTRYGHKISHKSLGCKVQAIRREEDGRLHGVSDPREEGMAFGI